MRGPFQPFAFTLAALALRSYVQGRRVDNNTGKQNTSFHTRLGRFRDASGVTASASSSARTTTSRTKRAGSSALTGSKQVLLRRGGDNHSNKNPERVFWECLPTGTRIKQWKEHGLVLWIVPIAACVLSFTTFPWLSRNLYEAMQWASHRTWTPQNKEEVDLQTNVVVRSTLYLHSLYYLNSLKMTCGSPFFVLIFL